MKNDMAVIFYTKRDLSILAIFFLLIILSIIIYNFSIFLFFVFYIILFIVLSFFNFSWALALLIFSVYLNGLYLDMFGNFTIRIDQILFILSLIIFVLFYFQGKLRLYSTPLDRPIAVFVLINLLSSLFYSQAPSLTFRKSLLLALYSLLYFMFVNIILNSQKEGENQFKIFKDFSLAAIAMMLIGLINLFFYFLSNLSLSGIQVVPAEALTPNVPHDVSVSRIFSTVHEPNIFGNIASVFSLIFLCLLFSQVDFRRDQKWLFFFFGLISILGNFFSYTRGSWLSFLAGCLFIFIFGKKLKINLVKMFKYLLVLLIILFIVLGISFLIKEGLYTAYWQKIKELVDYQSGTGRVRLSMWEKVIKDIPSSWLIGHGTQGYLFLFDEDETVGLANFPLDVIHSSGIMGFLVFLWVQIKVIILVLKKIKESKDLFLRTILGSIMISFIAMWVGNFFICVYWLSFPWVLMAIMVAYSLKYADS